MNRRGLSLPFWLSGAALLLSLYFAPSSFASSDHDSHRGHSDTLLMVLKHKITIKKLQTQFQSMIEKQSYEQIAKANNLEKQDMAFKRAMALLEEYLSIPESRYPNMDLYHQSLISRAGLLQEFHGLISTFHLQSQQAH